MKLAWVPLLSARIGHAALTAPLPLRLVPTPETAAAMRAFGLRADPNVPAGSLGLHAREGDDGTPVLQAPDDCVLTFRMEAEAPELYTLTDLPEPPLVRCYDNRATHLKDGLRWLSPPSGTGAAAQGPMLALKLPAGGQGAQLTRTASGAQLGALPVVDGWLRADLSDLPEGRYELQVAGKPAEGFYLLPPGQSVPFGCIEITLRAAVLGAAERPILGDKLQPQSYGLELPARPCLLRYTVIGLTAAAQGRIEAEGGAVDFAPMEAVQFAGRDGFAATARAEVPLTSTGPRCTLHYRADGAAQSLALPVPAAARITPQAGGQGWLAEAVVYL